MGETCHVPAGTESGILLAVQAGLAVMTSIAPIPIYDIYYRNLIFATGEYCPCSYAPFCRGPTTEH